MEIQKRDCGIKIKFHDLGAGWLYMDFDIENEHFDFSSTDWTGDGLDDLINAIFQLNPKIEDYEVNSENIKFNTTLGIPISAKLTFDEEGSFIYWNFEREETENVDCNLTIHLTVDRGGDGEGQNYKFIVRYKDFCYALAKACTEMLKEYGITGYFKSCWKKDFSLRQLLRIKAFALDDFSYIDTTYNKDNYSEKSNINKELEFLLLDM